MSLSSIDVRVAGTNSFWDAPGASQQFAYSTDGVNFTLIGSPIISIRPNATFSVDVSGVPALQEVPEGTTITLRYYASGQTSTGGWGFFSNSAGNYGLAINGSLDVVAGAVVPPSNFTATPVSASQINVSWDKNDDDENILLAVNSSNTFGEPTGTYTAGNSISGGGIVLAVGDLASFEHTSLDESTEYFYAIWSKNTGNSYSPVVNTSATTAKNEPSNHATNVSIASGRNSIIISWNDATGLTVPDGYLVLVSESGFGSISNPTDGEDPSNDFDLSEGSASVKVNANEEFVTFVGLDLGKTYFAKVFPYTNQGSLIDFKTDGSIPQVQAEVVNTIRVFRETFSTSSTTDFDEYSSSDNPSFTFDGVGDVRSTLVSSGYPGASGGGNAFFTTQPRELIIGGINTLGLENLTLQFGMNSSANVGLTVEVSTDGVEYIPLNYNPRPAAGWNLETIPNAQIPQAENVRLRFTNNSLSIRLDDLELYQAGFEVNLTGVEGYRILSSPVETSWANLLNPIWTQGITGSDFVGDEETAPNVFTWNNSSTSADAFNWNPLANLSNTIMPGSAALVYVFQNDVPAETGSFPKTLSVSGTQNELPVNPTMNPNGEGLTLVGNPIASVISWDAMVTNGLSGVVYTWDVNDNSGIADPSENNNTGSWKSYNGDTGSLTGGLIHPFQGFFVQTTGNEPSLLIGQGVESSGGQFYGKDREPWHLRLNATHESTGGSTWLSFAEHHTIGKDNYDALQFQPLSNSFTTLATQIGDELIDINSLPLNLEQEVRIPLILESSHTGTFTLNVGEFNIPEHLIVLFEDIESGDLVEITSDFDYVVTLNRMAKFVESVEDMLARGDLRAMASADAHKFNLVVGPRSITSIDAIQSELPSVVTLSQNYPNPFNPTSRIDYQLPAESHVRLSVFDLLGREVAVLVNESMRAGSHFVSFDASSLSSGVYIYRLQAGGEIITRKMTLVK